MPVVADASVAIRADMSGFQSDLKRAEGTVGGFATRASQSIRNTFSARNLLGAFGLAYGANQLVQLAGDAAQAYGELEQTVRTIDQTFGDSAEIIRDWGETAAETAGMSQQTFMSSAAVMGTTLQNMGFTIQDSAEKTVELLGRAADLAIAFGKRPQDALLAITAAMRGERDTIEKFGIAIKQVDVNARIAALGLDTSTAAARKNAEAMAVVDLVLEQSADSQGRFAESQEDIAVQMAQVNAKWDDFLAKDVGAAVASIQLGAFKVADAVGGYMETASGNIDAFAMNFGHQRTVILDNADKLGMGFGEMKEEVIRYMREMGVDFETAVAMINGTAETSAELVTSTFRMVVPDAADALIEDVPIIESAAQAALADPIIVAMLGGKEAAEEIAGETPESIAQALLDQQFVVADAYKILKETGLEALSPMKEQSMIEGFLASSRLAAGLASNIPAVAQRARELKEAAEARLAELSSAAFYHGLATAESYAAGMNAGYGYVYTAAGGLAAATRNQIGINSEPKDHSSPLYGITKWGGNLVDTYVDGIFANLGTAASAAGALAGALSPSVGGGGMAMGGGGSVGSGSTYQLIVDGEARVVGSRNDVLSAWEQLERFGA